MDTSATPHRKISAEDAALLDKLFESFVNPEDLTQYREAYKVLQTSLEKLNTSPLGEIFLRGLNPQPNENIFRTVGLDAQGCWVLLKERPSNTLELGTPEHALSLPEISLEGPLPRPRVFLPALLKALGILTGNRAGLWVRSHVVVDLVLELIGISEENCPWSWPWTGKPSLQRQITLTYRNTKEGYKKKGPLFLPSAESGKWALNELGAREAAKYNPNPLKVVVERTLEEKPFEENQTIKWLDDQGASFLSSLRDFATRRFPKSERLSKIEDHVQNFLTKLIANDTIGAYYRRHQKWPQRESVLSWWQRNSIVSQLRAEGKEPVCIALHETKTQAQRAKEEAAKSRSLTKVFPKEYLIPEDVEEFFPWGSSVEDLDARAKARMVAQFQAPSWEDPVIQLLDFTKSLEEPSHTEDVAPKPVENTPEIPPAIRFLKVPVIHLEDTDVP